MTFKSFINYADVKIPFDISLALTRGVFVSGGKGSGKTNLMKIFVNELMGKTVPSHRLLTKGEPRKVVVHVIDPSQAWLRSPIPYYQTVTLEDVTSGKIEIPLNESMVYDVSRLYVYDQKLFIGELLGSVFELIVNNPIPVWIYFVIEEAQLIFPSGSLRALWAQEGLRAITVGRNYDETVSTLTQYPATVSTNLIKAVGLGYFGISWESNDLRKLQRFVRWKRAKVDETFPSLKVGEFVYLKTGRNACATKITTPEFIPKSEPKEWIPRRKQSFFQKVFKRRRLL